MFPFPIPPLSKNLILKLENRPWSKYFLFSYIELHVQVHYNDALWPSLSLESTHHLYI